MLRKKFGLRILLLISIVVAVFSTTRASFASPITEQEIELPQNTQKAVSKLENMTVEEKIGQLFLITFDGNQIGEDSAIIELIVNYNIGGVLLKPDNDNFTDPDSTLLSTYEIVSYIQQSEWDNSDMTEIISSIENDVIPEYIPVLVGISQESTSKIINSITAIPNQMAIGATWNSNLAYQAGEIIGKDISNLGINLYLGPSLDISDPMLVEEKNILDSQTFGENAYWVGQFGQSYISGIHEGSNNKIAVIPLHFPGIGSSDRSPETEVATVRKPFEEMLTSELAPFFDVTGLAVSENAQADGLLLSHTRYEGLQGFIHPSTRPVSFDASAIEELTNLTQLAEWRSQGGILISDSLGSQAIRKFYDPTEQLFDARQTASHAFLAGNDLLILDNFISTGDPDQTTTIIRTLEFFKQKYEEDTAFAQRVDQSVTRILALKYELYPEFNIENVVPSYRALEFIGEDQNTGFEIAQESATLLSPKSTDLKAVLPDAPGTMDRIAIISDDMTTKPCNDCAPQNIFSVDDLREAIVRLYGPDAGGQTFAYRISTYTFNEVLNMLNGGEDTKLVEDDIRASDWIIFGFADQSEERLSATVVDRLIAERQDLIRNKYTIAFAYGSPYFLDATDLSNFTAYYGLYSNLPEFVDVSARILFQEFNPTGASPVSINAVGYNLQNAILPAKDQIIPLKLNLAALPQRENPNGNGMEATVMPTPVPSFKVGDTLPLITGLIYDTNHNPVPNGTLVNFIFTSEGIVQQQIEAHTINGVAQAGYLIQQEGNLEISVVSEPALQSSKLALNVSSDAAAVITVIATSQTQVETLAPTETQIVPTQTATPEPTATAQIPEKTTGLDWGFSIVIIIGLSIGIYFLGHGRVSTRWGLRWSLLSIIGGLIAYMFITIKQPGNIIWIREWQLLGFILTNFVGSMLGWLCGVFWYVMNNRRIHK